VCEWCWRWDAIEGGDTKEMETTAVMKKK